MNKNVDPEVYNEEYKSISEELGEVRKKRWEHDKVNESKDGLKQRFDEILEAINSLDTLLEALSTAKGMTHLMKKYLMRW